MTSHFLNLRDGSVTEHSAVLRRPKLSHDASAIEETAFWMRRKQESESPGTLGDRAVIGLWLTGHLTALGLSA